MYSLLLCYFCIVSYLFYLSFSTNAPFMDICPLFSFSLLLELNGAVSRSLSFFLPSSYLFFSLFLPLLSLQLQEKLMTVIFSLFISYSNNVRTSNGQISIQNWKYIKEQVSLPSSNEIQNQFPYIHCHIHTCGYINVSNIYYLFLCNNIKYNEINMISKNKGGVGWGGVINFRGWGMYVIAQSSENCISAMVKQFSEDWGRYWYIQILISRLTLSSLSKKAMTEPSSSLFRSYRSIP